MAKRHGFLLKDLALYLFLGSLLLITALKLFEASWHSFQTIRRIQTVTADFLNVSERIKHDLLGPIDEIGIGRTSCTYHFLRFANNQTDYAERDYSIQMHNSRLIYYIDNGTSLTAVYLSSLVKEVFFEHGDGVMYITFDYGDYSFRRCYRLDHIKTQRLYYSFLPDPAPLLHRVRRSAFHDGITELVGAFDLLV